MIEKLKTDVPMETTALLLALTTVLGPAAMPAFADHSSATATPIQHLVVIFQENVSFDHYFGTYPLRPIPMGNRDSRRLRALPR
jgi:phospholipase C